MEYQRPTNSDLNEAELTGIIIGAVFVFLMSIAGAVFIYRRASKNFRKFMKPLPIEKIEIPTSDKKITPANSTSSSESSNGDVSSTSKLIKNGNPKYYRQISKDSGRGSLSSDGLASPDITSRQDLFPVPEESTGNLEDSRKQTSDEKNKSQHPLPSNPDYSKVTHELGGHANSLFRQNDVTVASVLRRSCPNMNDKKFSGPDHHDGSSQKISSTSLASCKSSSEEKVWLDTECDNDGYMDEKEKSKSMEAVSSKDRRSTGGFDSYVLTGQVSEENSNVTEYSDMDSDGKNSFYVDESKVKSLSIEVNQSNDETESNSGYTDSCNINSRSQNNGPLLEIDEDSCISLISNGCYEDSDFNRSGRLISSPQQSPRSEPGSKSDVYHRLDSIENPQYHDLLTPLVSTNDSASCFGYVRNDILEVEPQRNLPAKENISSDNSDRLQNADAPSKSNSASANNGVIDNDGYLSDSGSIRSEKSSLFNCHDNPEDTSVVSPYITETELCEKFQETGSTEKDGTDGESDSDESDSLLNTPESTINGYVPHNFCQN